MAYQQPELPRGHVLAAAEMNALIAEVKRLGKISFMAPMGGTSDDTGISIRYEGSNGLIPGQLTSSLATGTISSPASATVTLLVSGSSGALATTGGATGLTVYNTLPLTSTLSSGTNVWMTYFGGSLYLIQAGC